MKTICAWCKTVLNDDNTDGGMISHGICTKCRDWVRGDVANTVPLETFLDTLPIPVVVVNRDLLVETANQAALRALGKEKAELAGYSGGDVIECAYARLPGGCGNTEHCSGCVIRNTVTKSFVSGENIENAVAHNPIGHGASAVQTRFQISTSRISGYVLLRIDEMGPV